MTSSRKRVIDAIGFNRPDRAPISHILLPAALLKHGERLIEIAKRYPNDFGPSEFHVPKREELPPCMRRGINEDEWGIVWGNDVDGIRGQVLHSPLKNWDSLANYNFPPLSGEDSIQHLKKYVRDMKDKGYFVILGFDPNSLFEQMQWLRGYTNLMKDFFKKPKELYILADMLLQRGLESIERNLQAKPDAISFSDDWGTQERLMVNPSFWRSFFKPRYRKMFKLVHDGGAYVYFHSDGYIMDIISDLAEIGVNIIFPQFSCHEMENLAASVRGRLCVFSDVDRQYILPFGTPKQIKDYIKKMVDLFGYSNEGALICQGEINVDVPLENVEAMYEGFVSYGKYQWR